MPQKDSTTSTDYENPYRPFPVRVFNAIGRSGERLGFSRSLDIGALIDQAKRKTELSDFGDDGHFHALEVLAKSINDEADLTATGRLIQKIPGSPVRWFIVCASKNCSRGIRKYMTLTWVPSLW